MINIVTGSISRQAVLYRLNGSRWQARSGAEIAIGELLVDEAERALEGTIA